MNRNFPPPRDMERPLQQGGYPHPSVPPKARAGPQRQPSRPTREQQQQPHPAPQRRPDQQYQEQQRQPVLQRQRSRPDPPYQEQPPLHLQQSQPSRPDQYYQQQAQSPMAADPYQYNPLPVQPVAPAFVRAPSAPLPYSDSQSTLPAPTRPYAENILIRGNSDDELDKTDVFWRRFNVSAQQPDTENAWLEKHEGKSSRSRRTMWIAGLLIILLAAGGIGIGIFLSFRNSSDNTRPNTIGGAADITSGATGATPTAKGTVGSGGVATTSSLHVSPTNTVP